MSVSAASFLRRPSLTRLKARTPECHPNQMNPARLQSDAMLPATLPRDAMLSTDVYLHNLESFCPLLCSHVPRPCVRAWYKSSASASHCSAAWLNMIEHVDQPARIHEDSGCRSLASTTSDHVIASGIGSPFALNTISPSQILCSVHCRRGLRRGLTPDGLALPDKTSSDTLLGAS